MIDDDDIAGLRALVHQVRKQRSNCLHFWPVQRSLRASHLGPGAARFGKLLDLRAVAEFGGLFPSLNHLEIGHLFEAGEDGFTVGVVDLLAAGVVIAALM